jgi:hypothetical protein
VHKCSFLGLFDLEAEEELQLTIMLISNSLLMSSANLATKELDEPPKTISSTYIFTIKISLP